MKTRLILIMLVISSSFIFSSCYDCHSCLKNGESFDLPYSSDQSIVFFSDSQKRKTFIVQTSIDNPPNEYCGRVGSESYGACNGRSSALLKENPDSNAFINIWYEVSGGSVENNVYKNVSILNSSISFGTSFIETYDRYGSAEKLESLSINGIQYPNVYVYKNDSVDINDCSYFVYSVSYGVIEFSIRRNNNIEKWGLKN